MEVDHPIYFFPYSAFALKVAPRIFDKQLKIFDLPAVLQVALISFLRPDRHGFKLSKLLR